MAGEAELCTREQLESDVPKKAIIFKYLDSEATLMNGKQKLIEVSNFHGMPKAARNM